MAQGGGGNIPIGVKKGPQFGGGRGGQTGGAVGTGQRGRGGRGGKLSMNKQQVLDKYQLPQVSYSGLP